ncbi:MAG: hypothetical protein IKS96_07075 [Fibrobacter sp.]|nr:hypothetical protein [Fibrobacter sp.]MBR6449689.1 hypothetical protein [Fibrobacter sp.]
MVRWSMERVEQYPMARENGKKGGRPRKNDNKGDACRREAQDESATVSDISGTPEARQGKKRTGDTQSKGDCHSEKSPVRTMPLPSWEEFLEFVDGEGLDYTDAREWWEMTMEDREGKDRDGNPIRNWKAALQGYCKTKTENRR